MSVLENKIDFKMYVSVRDANPNGDPLAGNRPRTSYDGIGEISPECIKRKMRNRFQDLGERIFVQSDDRCDDGYRSLSERAKHEIKAEDGDEYTRQACEKWLDVRSFGQLFAFKGGKKKGEGVSLSVRGPVTVHMARSLSPINVNTYQVTRSVSSIETDGDKKSSDTIGIRHTVRFGLYEVKGSINIQLAQKTGLADKDVELIKESLRTLFENDASAARPEGSMKVEKLFWWRHNCQSGQYSSAVVHRSVEAKLKDGVAEPSKFEDYEIIIHQLDGLQPEIIDGF